MSSKYNEVVTILIQQVIKAKRTKAEYLAELQTTRKL